MTAKEILISKQISDCQNAFRIKALKYLNEAKSGFEAGIAETLLCLSDLLGKIQGEGLGTMQDAEFFGAIYCEKLFQHCASFEGLDYPRRRKQ